jgi:outer membrane receptor for ferrienterochelin and colicins
LEESISQRLAGICKLANEKTVFKLLYGEAFQESSAEQLYGGWSGRKSNVELSSEKAKNIELILMQQEKYWLLSSHCMLLHIKCYSIISN